MRQVVATIIGTALVAVGLALLVLPGPGLLVVFAGLTVLATHWEWAERLAERLRATVSRATHRHRAATPFAPHDLDGHDLDGHDLDGPADGAGRAA